ncbi:hypothetical protein NDU88_006189 [Pleurodeles waltl]|uniref:Uncharacterized protein n=1 Tax=Pleurodeles waltl TaxID=8319 RepID=A0AAV7NTP2_PLEWA|nr:hypothetical protein NDU88_006189 [Pleurodeles waltl]
MTDGDVAMEKNMSPASSCEDDDGGMVDHCDNGPTSQSQGLAADDPLPHRDGAGEKQAAALVALACSRKLLPPPAASAPRTVLTQLPGFPRLFSPVDTESAPRPWRLVVPADSPRPLRPSLCAVTATAALPHPPRVCDTDRWCWRAAVVGRRAARPTPLGRAADCAARRTGCRTRLGTAQACWRGELLGFVLECDPCCLWGVALGAWGFLMAPKPIRTPWTSRARHNPDPTGGGRDKRHPAPCSKKHTNPRGRGAQQGMPGMEKAVRNAVSVPIMFANVIKAKQTPPQRKAPDTQPCTAGTDGVQVSALTDVSVSVSVSSAGVTEVASPEITGMGSGNSGEVGGSPLFGDEKTFEQKLKVGLHESNQGEINVESRSLAKDICSQGTEDMVKFLAISETISPSLVQRRKEEKPSGAKSDHGLLDTGKFFFSLSNQSRDSDLDEEIPLSDSDIECSSSASIWASNHLTCRRK